METRADIRALREERRVARTESATNIDPAMAGGTEARLSKTVGGSSSKSLLSDR